MKKIFGLTIFLISCYLPPLQAWNALGHRIIAQIAIDQLPKSKVKELNHLNRALNIVYAPMSLVNAAIWPDLLRTYDVKWLDVYHYIDIPFTVDNSPLPDISEVNAVAAIQKALKTLNSNKASTYDRGVSLRMLMHVTGDLHQPMHAVTRVSRVHAHGDQGGNLYLLKNNPIGNTLHAYWDKGGGFLSGPHPVRHTELQRMAKSLHARWPCDSYEKKSDPAQWAQESHTIAVTLAYSIPERSYPEKNYQQHVQNITQKRLAQAACRLARLLGEVRRESSASAHNKGKKRS